MPRALALGIGPITASTIATADPVPLWPLVCASTRYQCPPQIRHEIYGGQMRSCVTRQSRDIYPRLLTVA